MIIKNLATISFETIIDCFLLAFDDYLVKMPSDKNYYKHRWEAAKVDFSFSYGMFDGDKMVGFIIHAIDNRNGKGTAFNTGTGVISDYRGRGIVKSLYKHALNDLTEKNIAQSVLEVITKNEIAISVYKSIGFKITKTYKCFGGNIEIDPSFQVDLKEVALETVDWRRLPNQQYYSWDNQQASILRGNYKCYKVFHDGKPESFFIINSEQAYLSQFDLFSKNKDGWKRLFTGIQKISAFIKTNNIDDRLKEKLNNLTRYGLKNTVDQFEMELLLKDAKGVITAPFE